MNTRLLAINVGSSSVKFALFGLTRELPLYAKGSVKGIGTTPIFSLHTQETHVLDPHITHEGALQYILKETVLPGELGAVVHRIVHGGTHYTKATQIDQGVMENLKALIPLAPLHQPHNLAGIDILAKTVPLVPQIATFDTAFHMSRCPLTSTFALPKTLRDQGIQRYGFHGLSYEWIVHALQTQNAPLSNARLVAAHLGSGASVCALHGGKSVDTSMGMTALDGLPMGTRSGSLDPGAILYMMEHLKMSASQVSACLYEDSGLKGLSGISSDVKTLLASPDPQAFFALEYFALKVAQFMAMMAVSMGGVDAFVFTGGIGEKAPTILEDILHYLSFFGAVPYLTIPANEERMMARHAYACLHPGETL